MTKGLGWIFGLWVSSRTTLTEEEKKLIEEIKEAGIPCEIIYSEPRKEEPVLLFNCRAYIGYAEIRRFIKNWERVWKPEYERLLKEAPTEYERLLKVAKTENKSSF
jgi:alpha-glucosidase (family GH31 glycosyl hydrolase)